MDNYVSTNCFKFNGVVEEKKFKDLQNVGSELKAALKAVEIAVAKKWEDIVICHDYLGISEYANHKWHSEDTGIIKYMNEIKEFRKIINIEFIKVPAYTGIDGNELADKLSKEAVEIERNDVKDKFRMVKIILKKEDSSYYKNLYKQIFKMLTRKVGTSYGRGRY